ncbi:MAG: Uncharacterized protein XE08_0206 [Parcubacteria bacterium 32_520]|nr:MAG: Uncharacterized protein XE08_0206 [Parcubacteria bacterium 32_520]
MGGRLKKKYKDMNGDVIMSENELMIKETNILDATSPRETILVGTEIANILKNVIDEQKLYSNIQGKKYVQIEGWTTLATILNLRPIITDTERVTAEDEIIYRAHCEVRDNNDHIVGSADAMCSNKERNWRGRDEFAIMSMAQTRSISKALRLPLGWIMTLAGYSATPSEEMTFKPMQAPPSPPRKPMKKPARGVKVMNVDTKPEQKKKQGLNLEEVKKKNPHIATAIETIEISGGEIKLSSILKELRNMREEDEINDKDLVNCKKALGVKT